jgi:hypothetical protein
MEPLLVEGVSFSKSVDRQAHIFVGAVHFALKLPFPAVEDVLRRELGEVPLFPAQFRLGDEGWKAVRSGFARVSEDGTRNVGYWGQCGRGSGANGLARDCGAGVVECLVLGGV